MMRQHFKRSWLTTGAAALILAGSVALHAQGEFNNNLKYDSGQDVQPVFEGWVRRSDGTFDLYFGYLNRNWVQKLHIPLGPDNAIEPGGPDRGQPTFFHTRTNRKIFAINVPADFGRNELVWTVTANGRARSVYGHLKPDWEITADGGAGGTQTTKEARSNKPPTLEIQPVAPVVIPAATTLVATVSDDGLPKPRNRKPAVGQETPPGLSGGVKEAPTNLPWLAEQDAERGSSGLGVRWFVFRGPADAEFEPARAIPADGRTATLVRFTEPGQYVLRAGADDGLLTTFKEVTVTVSRR